MPELYIVATPIGNLRDVSPRAIEILKGVDLILCEDTRVTKKLLDHYGIKTQALSYHQHSKLKKVEEAIQLLKEGKNLALVSDAGTPGISDPGNLLIERIVSESIDDIKIAPIPGPSALTTSVSISGFPMDKFLFLGFPPAKKKRKKFFEEVLKSKYPVILYESSHRILKTMRELKELTSFQKELSSLRIVVCHELTKMFETIYRGNLDEIITQMNEKDLRGEFVIIINSGVK